MSERIRTIIGKEWAEVFKNKMNKKSAKVSGGQESKDLMRKYMNFMGGALIPVLKEGEKLDFR